MKKKHLILSLLIPITFTTITTVAISCKQEESKPTESNKPTNQVVSLSFNTNPVLNPINNNQYELVVNVTNANNKTLVAKLTKKDDKQTFSTVNKVIVKDNVAKLVFSNLAINSSYYLSNVSILENNNESKPIDLDSSIVNHPLIINWDLDLIKLDQQIPANATVAKWFYDSYKQLSEQEKRFNWVVAQINANASSQPESELTKIKEQHKMFALITNTISTKFLETYSSHKQEQLSNALNQISSILAKNINNTNTSSINELKTINTLFLKGLIAAELELSKSSKS
ncbi:hypothetical protein [Ureaplasma diversum]|uniref:Lipoprotein n=1 Tax=Ureaplasma diversum NCTC 246 TaxID=1188241 RepID=A0A084EXJ2_9BACT|nr:hypothetical protein [Ureaplasma diversum]KEZ22684.1 Hypothetical protein, predicted lipoprotein [Ureaplasma diversum NCTC 246]